MIVQRDYFFFAYASARAIFSKNHTEIQTNEQNQPFLASHKILINGTIIKTSHSTVFLSNIKKNPLLLSPYLLTTNHLYYNRITNLKQPINIGYLLKITFQTNKTDGLIYHISMQIMIV